jgi:hypothetical protein
MPPDPRRVSTRWAGFSVVSVHEVCEITGLTLEQVLTVPGAEQMTRIQGEAQEQAVRVPSELLEAAIQDQQAVADALSQYRNGGSDAELRARIREIVDADTPSGPESTEPRAG